MAIKPLHNIALAIKRAIDNAPMSREKLQDLLPGTYFNRNKVHPVFKKITGFSFTQYRRQKRVEAAAAMLISHEDWDIQQVVHKCGHKGKSAQSNFARDFKEVTGMTPSAWVTKKRLEIAQNALSNGDSKGQI